MPKRTGHSIVDPGIPPLQLQMQEDRDRELLERSSDESEEPAPKRAAPAARKPAPPPVVKKPVVRHPPKSAVKALTKPAPREKAIVEKPPRDETPAPKPRRTSKRLMVECELLKMTINVLDFSVAENLIIFTFGLGVIDLSTKGMVPMTLTYEGESYPVTLISGQIPLPNSEIDGVICLREKPE